MNRTSQRLMRGWLSLGPRFLPFADAASREVPLSRLLRLSMFQLSVGMALVLLVGTLNRVMIVELGVPASLVAIMLALPVLAAPFRALVGFRSDTHKSLLGWRRVPFIWMGTMTQFGGLAIMPFALLVLAGAGESGNAPLWIGHAAAALAFLLVGAGLHTVQTVGLALATDIVPEDKQPQVVGLMYVMLLVGMVGSALVFGWLLQDFNPGKLVQVIQGAAVLTIILNIISLWQQEPRNPDATRFDRRIPSFAESWNAFLADGPALRRLVVLGAGSIGFAMQDVLLEPFGGEVLKLSVASTTWLTATLAFGGLLGFATASRILGRGGDAFRMAATGAAIGIPGFLMIAAAAPFFAPMLLSAGALVVGIGGGLFGHGTLTATMRHAPREQIGMALGAWGAVQATAAGLGMAAGGVLRDVMNSAAPMLGRATGYLLVYGIEVLLLLATLLAMWPLLRGGEPPVRNAAPAE
ncbi:MAG: MFS transporter [Alphaproteobacteria bacterium]|nr:MFS transporter [Alphaproteobacteria bacterium]